MDELLHESYLVFESVDLEMKEVSNIVKNIALLSTDSLPWVTESTKSIKNGIISAFQKIKNTTRKLLDWFSDRKVVKLLSSAKGKDKECKIKGKDPRKVKEFLNKKWEEIKTWMTEFKNSRPYKKVNMTITAASLPIPIPASTEATVGLLSLLDFLNDYRKVYQGKQADCIIEFSNWVEKNNQSLDESEIYNRDKILSKLAGSISSFLSVLSGETKRIFVVIAKESSVASEKIVNGMEKKIKEENKGGKISKHAETTSKMKNDLTKLNQDMKDVRNKRLRKTIDGWKRKGKSDKESVRESVDFLADMDLFEIGD